MSGTIARSPADVRGLWAIMPTPAVEGAEDPAARDTVDRAESVRAVEALISDGVDAVLSVGTFGEGASLTWDEVQAFAGVLVDSAAKRVPVFVGATTLNTRDTIDRARRLQAIGVDGLLLGRPMWSYLDEVDLVRYYAAVAAAAPELAIIVYDNPEAFKGKISTAAYAELSRIPQVIAAKYAAAGPSLAEDVEAVGDRMRLLPVDREWYRCWQAAPNAMLACWSGSASCGPRPHVELARRIADGDAVGAAEVDADLTAASAGFLPQGQFALFSQYNVQMEKARINAAGYIKAGPCRPPYLNLPDAYAEGARESGRRFAELHSRYGDRARRVTTRP